MVPNYHNRGILSTWYVAWCLKLTTSSANCRIIVTQTPIKHQKGINLRS